MSEPKIDSDEWFAEREKAWKREASEFTQDPLPPRINGPAILLMCHADRAGGGGTNSLLMMPVGPHYDEMIVLAEWRMADKDSTARLDATWTADEFPDQTSTWSDLLTRVIAKESMADVPLVQPSRNNTVKLTLRGMKCLTVGFRLNTYPTNAKLDAKIRVLLLGGGKEKES